MNVLKSTVFSDPFISQYNCISLGFAVGAVAAILSKRDLLGAILFSLSLNHKQVLDGPDSDFLGEMSSQIYDCVAVRSSLYLNYAN